MALNQRQNRGGFGEVQLYVGARFYGEDEPHRTLVFQTAHPDVAGFQPSTWPPMVQAFLSTRVPR